MSDGRDPHEIHEVEERFLDRLDLGIDAPVIHDVGANIGGFASAALDRWPEAKVTCWEPNPASIDRLRERMGNRVAVIPTALSDLSGSVTLYCDGGPDVLASLHKRDLGFQGMTHGSVEVTVPAYRYSGFVTCDVDLLKIDVEGHELAVLKGGGSMLKYVRRIYFEFNSCNLASRTFFKDFWDLLTPRFLIAEINQDGEPVAIPRYTPLLENFDAHRDFLAVRR